MTRLVFDAVKENPADDRYLEAALAGDAPYIVSGDKHLLKLQEYRGIHILTPKEFLAFLNLQGM